MESSLRVAGDVLVFGPLRDLLELLDHPFELIVLLLNPEEVLLLDVVDESGERRLVGDN